MAPWPCAAGAMGWGCGAGHGLALRAQLRRLGPQAPWPRKGRGHPYCHATPLKNFTYRAPNLAHPVFGCAAPAPRSRRGRPRHGRVGAPLRRRGVGSPCQEETCEPYLPHTSRRANRCATTRCGHSGVAHHDIRRRPSDALPARRMLLRRDLPLRLQQRCGRRPHRSALPA